MKQLSRLQCWPIDLIQNKNCLFKMPGQPLNFVIIPILHSDQEDRPMF